MNKGEMLTKFEAWLVVGVVAIISAGMVWGYWSISPWAVLAVIGIASYPLWVYWRKVCGSCEHTNCPFNRNR